MRLSEVRPARGTDAVAPGPTPDRDERVLVLAPTGRDAELACAVLRDAGMAPEVCPTTEELCSGIEAGAGAALVAEEAIGPPAVSRLVEALGGQPPWSDFPLVVFPCAGEATPAGRSRLRLLEPLRNVTFLERPVRVMTLVSALRAALAARRRQYEVRDLVRRLEEGVRARDEFLAMLGHELRNPLGAICNAVQVLEQRGGGDERTVEMRELIVHQAGHLRRLVDDLLDVARVSAGKIVLRRRALDLRDVARRCFQALQLEAGGDLAADALDVQGRSLRLEAGPDPVPVDGDPARLEQVLTNLLTNACKYTPPGGRVTVSVRREGGEAVLAVRDTGLGIAPEVLPRLFEPFTQVVDSIARTRGGLGLGLALVRRLTELHGGTVSAHSDGPGRGSEFVVRLPLDRGEGGRPDGEPGEAPSPPPSPARLPPSSRRVLLVEDNPCNRQTLRLLVEMWGHRVEEADDGPAGLERLLADPPDVAVIDIGLPGLDGFEVARRVRASACGGRVILIALSGYGQPEDHRRALEAGFNAYLVKPVEPQVLARLLASTPIP